jgi:ankyrin repeat protein
MVRHFFLILFFNILGVSTVFSLCVLGLRPIENPFVKACMQKDVQMVNELLSKGANPNVVDKSSDLTPLMAASLGGCIEIVRLLLKAGANVDRV